MSALVANSVMAEDNGFYLGGAIGTTGIESIPRSHSKEIEQHTNWNDEDSIFELSQAVQKSVKAVNNTILSPRYRKAMVSVLTRRAIEEII